MPKKANPYTKSALAQPIMKRVSLSPNGPTETWLGLAKKRPNYMLERIWKTLSWSLWSCSKKRKHCVRLRQKHHEPLRQPLRRPSFLSWSEEVIAASILLSTLIFCKQKDMRLFCSNSICFIILNQFCSFCTPI